MLLSSKFQPEYSGSGLRAHNTYKRLEKKYDISFDVIVNSINHQGNQIYKYQDKEIIRISPPFKIVEKNPFRKITILFKICWEIFYSWKYIRKNFNQYDLLHTFGNSWTIGFLSWYFSKNNKPVIRELCNDMLNPLYPIQIQQFMKKIFKKRNTLVVAISKKLEILAKNFDMQNIWMRPNPVDENKFFIDFKNKYKFRNKLTKFNKEDIVLSCIANYRVSKNHIFLLDVLSLLPQKYKLVLAGPLKKEGEEYFRQIKEKIEKLKLQNRTDLQYGFVDNFDEYLKCSDIFLFPSLSEGLGTPVLESQSCGVPVVSNHLKDVTDVIIKNGEGGYFVEMDIAKWIEAIKNAENIKTEVLVKNAEYINEICSSVLIDEEYHKKIQSLINLN